MSAKIKKYIKLWFFNEKKFMKAVLYINYDVSWIKKFNKYVIMGGKSSILINT